MMRTFALSLACLFALAGTASADVAPAPAVVPFTSVPNAIVHPGDQINIQVTGNDDLSQKAVVVSSDGTIGLPLAGQVVVGGKSPDGAARAIEVALKRYVRDPHVIVSVAGEGHLSVMVMGAVTNSGSYTLPPGARLSDAVAAAGGMSASINGAYPVARVAFVDGSTYHISLEKLLRGGDPSRDIPLTDKAVIYIPGPATFEVTVMGAVDHPGTITVNEGDRLSIAIAKAGDTDNSRADLSHIMVTRTEPDGTTAAHPVDLYQSLEKGNTVFDPLLRKNDIVYVPTAATKSNILQDGAFLLGRLLLL